MTTYFYSDTGSDFSGCREKIEQYAIQHKLNIYMLRMPKNDVDETEKMKCF